MNTTNITLLPTRDSDLLRDEKLIYHLRREYMEHFDVIDEELDHVIEDIVAEREWQDYLDEHYNAPECNQ